MNVVSRFRIKLDDTEPEEATAYRLASACSQGTVLSIRGKLFRVLSPRPPIVRGMTEAGLNGNPVTLVEDISAPLVRTVKAPKPAPEPTKHDTEPPPSGPRDVMVQVGQKWVTRDSRRKPVPFTVSKVEGDTLITEDGRSILLSRLSRYRLVS
jgi:hypothetical protein